MIEGMIKKCSECGKMLGLEEKYTIGAMSGNIVCVPCSEGLTRKVQAIKNGYRYGSKAQGDKARKELKKK